MSESIAPPIVSVTITLADGATRHVYVPADAVNPTFRATVDEGQPCASPDDNGAIRVPMHYTYALTFTTYVEAAEIQDTGATT